MVSVSFCTPCRVFNRRKRRSLKSLASEFHMSQSHEPLLQGKVPDRMPQSPLTHTTWRKGTEEGDADLIRGGRTSMCSCYKPVVLKLFCMHHHVGRLIICYSLLIPMWKFTRIYEGESKLGGWRCDNEGSATLWCPRSWGLGVLAKGPWTCDCSAEAGL